MFTKLGPFKSHAEAVAYYHSKPRSGSHHNVVTVEYIPVFGRTGVEYGLKYVVRNLAGTEIRGPW